MSHSFNSQGRSQTAVPSVRSSVWCPNICANTGARRHMSASGPWRHSQGEAFMSERVSETPTIRSGVHAITAGTHGWNSLGEG